MKIKRIFAKRVYYTGDIEISKFESMVTNVSTTIAVMINKAIDNNELSKDDYNDTVKTLTGLLAMLESTEPGGFNCINCKFDIDVADVHDILSDEGLGMYSLSNVVDKYLDINFVTNLIITEGKHEMAAILLNMRTILTEFIDILQCVINNRYYDSVFNKGLGSPVYDFSKVVSKCKYPILEELNIPSFSHILPYN